MSNSAITTETFEIDNAVLVAYTAKTDDYTALVSDSVIELAATTTANKTFTLYSAGDKPGGILSFINNSDYRLTIDANGSETINGALTITLGGNAGTLSLVSDGTNWNILGQSEVLLYDADISAVSNIDINNIATSLFKKYKLVAQLVPSVDASINIRLSNDNGATFRTGATDYLYTIFSASGATFTASPSLTDSGVLHVNAESTSNSASITCDIVGAGSSSYRTTVFHSAFGVRNTGDNNFVVGAVRVQAVEVNNAIRLLSSAGTLTGHVSLWGVL